MAIKLIVTHKSPDLDAITSVWLLKRFDEQNFGGALISFVPPGDSISLEQLKMLGFVSYEVVHVDTGGGEFDHHTPALAKEHVCAASLVLAHLCNIHPELKQQQSLQRIVEHTIAVDHFEDSLWPERLETRGYYSLQSTLSYLKSIGLTDEEIVEYGMVSLDAIYASLKSVLAADKEIDETDPVVTKWGDALIVESKNAEIEALALKKSFRLVVRKDPEYKHMRILANPNFEIDLTPIYEKILVLDTQGTWYLHPGKRMLLNGSDIRRHQIATELSLEQVKQLIINS